MSYKNTNLFVPLTGTFLIFIGSFFGSLIILSETNIFGTANPQDAPEPITYAGGLLSLALLLAIIFGLIAFFLFSLKYEMQLYVNLLLVGILGIVVIVLSYILLRIIFDATNLFTIIKFPSFTSEPRYCYDNACIKDFYGLQYGIILSISLGVFTSILSLILLRKTKKI